MTKKNLISRVLLLMVAMAAFTVSAAGLLVMLPAALLTTTVNWEPLSDDVVAGVM